MDGARLRRDGSGMKLSEHVVDFSGGVSPDIRSICRKGDALVVGVSQEEINMEDAVMCDNGPKEISIFCHQTPEVKIVDLAKDHRGNNECLVLNINAPDVSSKMVLKCDGSIGGDDFGWGEDW